MREIEFRGKRVDTGEWVYGAFVPDALETPDNDLITWGFIRRYNRDIGKMETIEVARESVGQYAGLRDKNGKKIFEGDIVRDKKGRHLEVFWKEIGTGGWWFCYNQDGDRYHVDAIHLDYLEVIGNIHDSPSLLEVE